MSTLNLRQIQGFILRMYRMPMVRYFLLKVNTPAAARVLLGRLASGDERDAPQITTAEEWHVAVPGPEDDRQAPPRRKTDYCLNVGITWSGLVALEVKDRLPRFSHGTFNAFVEGAAKRAEALGDRCPMLCLHDSIRHNDPAVQRLLSAVEDAPSLSALILAAWQVARMLTVHLVEAVLAERARYPTLWPRCPQCGAGLRSKGFAKRQITSLFGRIQWRRRVGRCPHGCETPQVAPLRRRTWCLSWLRARHRGRAWGLASLSNCVMPHKSLRQGHTPRTPAMAIGLTDHVWSCREYIWLPVHPDPVLRQQMEARLTPLLTPALQAPPGDSTLAKPPPTEAKEKKADAIPKAA